MRSKLKRGAIMGVLGLFILLLIPHSTVVLCAQLLQRASAPPRGWNSYDSYSWVISEQQFLHNAKLVSEKLLPFGYEYVVVDFLWFRKIEPGASFTAAGFDNIDEWGRPIPDPARWPSSQGGWGLKPIADQVHALGLKFGIHVMRGISAQAVQDNTPVFGNLNQTWRARDIALQDEACPWMPQCFVHVNESSEGGKAFITSLYDLYASWEVDFVKHDCVFGSSDLSVEEISAVSQAIADTGRPMLYSISPGLQANPDMASLVNSFVNMYRVTGDDWDTWHDLQSHFDVARDFAAAGLIGARGLLGFSWPDLDMLPIGFLTDPGANHGPYRWSRLSLDEQRTQMTLWAMARSPLIFGGDMINIGDASLDILTNQIALEINANSYGNMEVQISDMIQRYTSSVNILDCEDAAGSYWSLMPGTTSKDSLQLCSTEDELISDGCFHWEPLTSAFTTRAAVPSGRVLMHENWPSCLDAQVNTSNRFSSCSLERTQIWHVETDRKLVNDATKLCAVVNEQKFNKEKTLSFANRIWMARGLGGEYYVALFNLQECSVEVSLPLTGIIEAGLQVFNNAGDPNPIQYWGSSRMDYQCTAKEAWSNQDIGTVKNRLHATLAPHGCALFSLLCNFL